MNIKLDRPSHLYRIGEKAVFHFEHVSSPAVLTFSCDGKAVLAARRIEQDC